MNSLMLLDYYFFNYIQIFFFFKHAKKLAKGTHMEAILNQMLGLIAWHPWFK